MFVCLFVCLWVEDSDDIWLRGQRSTCIQWGASIAIGNLEDSSERIDWYLTRKTLGAVKGDLLMGTRVHDTYTKINRRLKSRGRGELMRSKSFWSHSFAVCCHFLCGDRTHHTCVCTVSRTTALLTYSTQGVCSNWLEVLPECSGHRSTDWSMWACCNRLRTYEWD
jgi:hypothetical protein